MEMETRLKFLDQASKVLTPNGELSKLNGHLLYLRELFLEHGVWNIPKSKDPFPSVCPHCLMEFRCTSYTVTVRPSPQPSRNLAKIMLKEATSQHITGAQTVLLSRYRETRGKRLILICGLCKRETEVVLKKQSHIPRMKETKDSAMTHKQKSNFPKKQDSSIKNFVNSNIDIKNNCKDSVKKQVNNPPAHLKKKKKKDKFAGLKVTAVMSLKSNKKK